LGWGYAPAPVVDLLHRTRGPFNVSIAAHEAGIAALAEPGWVEKGRAHNIAERARLTAALTAVGIEVGPSEGNFVLARFAAPAVAEAADMFLRERGVIVRRVDGYGLPHCLRMTVGLADENDLVIGAMRDFMAALHG
jgi:histidinol-phosphate aminotransferase